MLAIIGLSLDIIGAIMLVSSHPSVPWNIQTWKGESPEEKAHKRKMNRRSIVGLCLLVGGFVLQLIDIILIRLT